ncbi:MAG: hypothetical protein GX878_03765, partial [Firmicutes bacterium]|nr:hypothetical protein [Bacillota bacterium]
REEHETAMVCKTINLQGRALKNELTLQILELEEKGVDLAELVSLMSGQRSLKAWQTGDVDNAPLMVGQSVGLIKEIPTCAEMIQTMVNDARDILKKNLARFEN